MKLLKNMHMHTNMAISTFEVLLSLSGLAENFQGNFKNCNFNLTTVEQICSMDSNQRKQLPVS